MLLVVWAAALVFTTSNPACADEGDVVWTVYMGNSAYFEQTGGVAVSDDGTIYALSRQYDLDSDGSMDAKLVAVESDGTEKWSVELSGYPGIGATPLILADGSIVVAVSGGSDSLPPHFCTVTRIVDEGSQGSVADQKTFTGTHVWTSPALSSAGEILLTDERGVLRALDPADLSVAWSFDAGTGDDGYNDLSAPTVGWYGDIYFSSEEDEGLYAISSTGTQKWFHSNGEGRGCAAVIDDDGTIYYGAATLYALNADGTEKWSVAPGTGDIQSPVIGKQGNLYLSTYNSWSYGFLSVEPSSGSVRWTLSNILFSASPVVGADGRIYILSDNGRVYVYNSDGSQAWNVRPLYDDNLYCSPTLLDNGLLVFLSNHHLWALESSTSGMASTAWPKGRHDQANTAYVANGATGGMSNAIGLLLMD